MRLVDRLDMRQRAERQPETDRRIARHQEQPAAAQLPKLADPAAARLRAPVLHRQHVAGRRGQMPLEFAHDAGALGRIVDLGIARIDVVRQRAVFEHPLGGILEGRQHVLGGDAEPARKALGEAMRVIGRDGAGRLLGLFRRDQRGVLPDRLAVGSPEQRERPARQRLAGIPFALAVMQQSARRELVGQSADQLVGQDALGRPERRRVPFRRLIVVDRDEGRLAAHRQADVVTSSDRHRPFRPAHRARPRPRRKTDR